MQDVTDIFGKGAHLFRKAGVDIPYGFPWTNAASFCMMGEAG